MSDDSFGVSIDRGSNQLGSTGMYEPNQRILEAGNRNRLDPPRWTPKAKEEEGDAFPAIRVSSRGVNAQPHAQAGRWCVVWHITYYGTSLVARQTGRR